MDVLKLWRQTTQFCERRGLDFRFPVKLRRQPLSYTHVWETLNDAAKGA